MCILKGSYDDPGQAASRALPTSGRGFGVLAPNGIGSSPSGDLEFMIACKGARQCTDESDWPSASSCRCPRLQAKRKPSGVTAIIPSAMAVTGGADGVVRPRVTSRGGWVTSTWAPVSTIARRRSPVPSIPTRRCAGTSMSISRSRRRPATTSPAATRRSPGIGTPMTP